MQLQSMVIADIVDVYNTIGAGLGIEKISRFKDRKTGIEMCQSLVSRVKEIPDIELAKSAPPDNKLGMRDMKEVELSAKQQEIFTLLFNSERRWKSDELIDELFGNNLPINAREIVIDRLRGIRKKLDYMNSRWELKSSKRNGPHPMEFWLELRDGNGDV